jgi:hypothetical protein
MTNDLVHAMHCQCMVALYVYTMISMSECLWQLQTHYIKLLLRKIFSWEWKINEWTRNSKKGFSKVSWKIISSKQSARWQQISCLKASAFRSWRKKLWLVKNATTYTYDWYHHLVGDRAWLDKKQKSDSHTLLACRTVNSGLYYIHCYDHRSRCQKSNTNTIKLSLIVIYAPR